ncbi:MAG TPA: hypothetical protein VIW78_08255 [Burkholderiales bacterium]
MRSCTETTRKRSASLCLAAWGAALFGCATQNAQDVKVYNPAQLRQGEYKTVARLWVETWRPPIWVPSYSSPEDGVAAMQDKATAVGANGLINVACYGDRGFFSFGSQSFVCYGNAIKVP